MAESKYLPLQDANGDGLNDVCDDVLSVTPPPCPTCIPNSFALVPNWRTRKTYEPFLNEKTCEYQITIMTKHTSALSKLNVEPADVDALPEKEAEAAVKDIADEYVETAIQALLDVYNKDDSEGSKDLIRDVIENTDWSLGVRPKARLKLLYSVPYDVLNALPEATGDEDDEATGPIKVSYDANEMAILMLKLRKGLWLYARNLKVYRAVDGANLLFLEDNSVFNLDQYGDYGTKKNVSQMGKLLPQLDYYLNSRGFNIQNVGSRHSATAPVNRLTFEFTTKYKLKKLTIEPIGCRDEPVVHTGKLTTLKQSGSPWTDPTAMAYFVNMRKMVDGLSARAPVPWKDLIINNTYPSIYDTITLNSQNMTNYDSTRGAVMNCIGEALIDEGKQLGQDIFDEVFGLGDAIAYKFHEYLCQTIRDDTESMQKELGLYLTTDDDGNVRMDTNNVLALAKEQALKQIKTDDMMFEDFCLYMFGDESEKNKTVRAQELWEELRDKFDRIKLCGLLDLLTEAIQCLSSGLSLEESLGKMIEAALNAMSVDNFGQLFIGLPADKQAELDALVKKKLESGDIFKDKSANQAASDEIVDNMDRDDRQEILRGSGIAPPITWTKPWNYSDSEKHDWKSTKDGAYNSMTYTEWTDYQENPTILGGAVRAQSGMASSMNPNIVMQAYVQALIETYAGNELELLDLLGKFPGAPIISYLIATLNCAQPGFFNPTIADFIKSLELPLCRDMREIAWPTLMVPPIDKIQDLWRLLLEAAKVALAQLIQKIIMMLMVKLCEIIGETICNALELVGDIAAAAAAGNSVADAIKESICGDDVDDEVLANTVQQLFQSFGNGGAAFADTELVMQFTADISSSVTRKEAAEAFLGSASSEFCAIVNNLIEYEYPSFRQSLRGTEAIAKAFDNMGKVMPADFRRQLQNFVDELPIGDQLAANPTLCVTPAQQEAFNNLRCELLQGRVSRDQCDKLNKDFKQQMANDLSNLAEIMQGGLPAYIENNMPPLVSDPGCDNGILPYEPPLAAAAVAEGLSSQLEMLKVDYSEDMLGNGPGQKNWGLINMILSDTLGQPLTVHHRKTENRKNRVDFYSTWEPNSSDFDPAMFGSAMSLMQSLPPSLDAQRGAYPYKVAEWLQTQLNELAVEYEPNNTVEIEDDPVSIDFKDLPGSGLFGNQVNFMKLPDFGYNIDIEPEWEDEVVTFTRLPRKQTPDTTLQFRDNADGLEEYAGYSQYGFDLEVYYADLVENADGVMINRPESLEDSDGHVVYTPSDSTRILINHVVYPAVDTGKDPAADQAPPPYEKEAKSEKDPGESMEFLAYEFMAIDDTFAHMTDLEENYPTFAQSFTEGATGYSPPLILLEEILHNNAQYAGGIVGIEFDYKETLSVLHEAINTTIAGSEDDEAAWLYGAEYDTLSYESIAYVVKEGQTLSPEGTQYQDAYVDNGKGGTRKIRNRDMILGVSYDQLINGEDARVTYLDPNTYGGNYMNPPVYIRPLKNNGWLGLVDALFPELSACKPANTDLVDFGDIQDMIDDIYPTMPDDSRLFQDPDCAIEVPYDRILNRSSKVFIMGLIAATIRIFCSVHIIRALSVFTRFAPKFPEVFSSVYASYIVEAMEGTLKSADSGGVFKDNEFWYQFLEQSVQSYAYRVSQEEIEAPPHVIAAMTRLENMQTRYDYPDKDDRKDAVKADEIPWFRTLKNYRVDENLEAIQETEDDAKIILKELVGEQLSFMSKKFVRNLKSLDMTPQIHNMDYFLLDNFTEGSSLTLNEIVNIDGSLQASYPDLPEFPYDDERAEADEPYHTSGGEFVIGTDAVTTEDTATTGEEYIGYYHVYIDEETGQVLYMAGEYHDDSFHDTLMPLVTITRVPVGDVPNLDEVSEVDKPFLIEKYIRITTPSVNKNPGSTGIFDTNTAVEMIKENNGLSLLSEVYPGTLEIVYDDDGKPVGLEGKLGVRYGLRFSMKVGSSYEEITSIEMDALDLPINQFSTISADSGILACLIKQLTHNATFKLVTQYIFPLRKMVSIMAIYTDMGFLPSIGQETAAEGASWPKFSLAALIDGQKFDPDEKPGVMATVTLDDDPTSPTFGAVKGIDYSQNPGWANKEDRPGWLLTLRFKSWDEWDRVLLRNTKTRVKKMFKTHYNDRDFDYEEMSGRGIGQLKIKELRGALKPPSGERLLPWWRKRRLRSNPFNADGELCENED